ncbi:hypothetical protein CCMA1212_001650 [Trichoderma ghanense]|uniref:Uncharacterized protein n=1 Tax=Trichoderma ghanense TaxID=65468 RepID=A0ABY2HFR8_9HYPO
MPNVEARSLSPWWPRAFPHNAPNEASGPPIAWAENRATAVDGGFSGPPGYWRSATACLLLRTEQPSFSHLSPHARFGAFSRGRRVESGREIASFTMAIRVVEGESVS